VADPRPVPDGFVVSVRTSPLIELIGPIYTCDDERGIVIGLQVRHDHLNTRGRLHGAIVAAVADIVLGRNASAATDPPTPLVTSSLTIDFVAAADEGDWIEATAEAIRVGRRLGFARALIRSGDRIVAQASGVFAVAR
jgi:acyl-coenzyme A thioesterase 13